MADGSDERPAPSAEMAGRRSAPREPPPGRTTLRSANLPGQFTLTLLFTDIEGSTRLWERHPDAMTRALRRHDALLRAQIETGGGHVFKTVGDAFCAVFTSAAEAAAVALASQRALQAEPWPEPAQLRVRMALHTGECESRDGDYFGPALNRVARLEALAHGGQVVVSAPTAALISERLPARSDLIDLGEHHLKDLDAPERVFQLQADDLLDAFPPLRSPGTGGPTNLLEPASVLVGREAEVAEVAELLASTRLVTLTGAGGVGKTRLALEVGRNFRPDVTDGVWLVELATVADPAQVPLTVLSTLGFRHDATRPATDLLLEALRYRRSLIVLDNCEHVLGDCAKLVDALVGSCPGMYVLATSRERLGVGREQVYRVPSLSLPDGPEPTVADAAASDAVALFVARAHAHQPQFTLDEDTAPGVVSICRDVDGIPLAVELAAARLHTMSLSAIAERLGDRFRLLTGGDRTALPRQQTLRALIDWSYDLLNRPERTVLARLSVFCGGFRLEAAEAVCARDDLEVFDITDCVTSLADKSLVLLEHLTADDVRYRLSETIRQYAADRLEEDPADAAATRTAHAAAYLGLVETAARHFEGPDEVTWAASLGAEEANLHTAADHLLATASGAPDALRMVALLRTYWQTRSSYVQHRDLVDAVLAHPENQGATAARSWVLFMAASNALDTGRDRQRGLALCQEAVAVARQVGDDALLAIQLSRQAWVVTAATDGADHVAMVPQMDEAIELARRSQDPIALLLTRWNQGLQLVFAGQRDQALDALHAAVASSRSMGYRSCTANLLGVLAELEIDLAHHGEALDHLTEALALADQLGLRGWVRVYLLTLVAELSLHEARWDHAYGAAMESLTLSREMADNYSAAWAVEFLARTMDATGRRDTAAYLFGAREAMVGVHMWTENDAEREERTTAVSRLHAALGPEEFDRLFTEGRGARSIDDVVRRLRADGPGPPGATHDAPG